MGLILLPLAILIGFAGYRHALYYERKRGWAAWDLPAWAWGIFFGVGLLFGALMWMVASRTTQHSGADGLQQVAVAAGAGHGEIQQAYRALPGWYADPAGSGGHRYWDGTTWTDRTS